MLSGRVALSSGIRLYQGDRLSQDRNEEWSITYRVSLRRIRNDLLFHLARLRQQAGQPELAIATLQHLMEEDPAHEEAQAAVMRALAGTGRHLDAIRQYRRLRTSLRQDLDMEPAVETQELIEQIQGR